MLAERSYDGPAKINAGAKDQSEILRGQLDELVISFGDVAVAVVTVPSDLVGSVSELNAFTGDDNDLFGTVVCGTRADPGPDAATPRHSHDID